MDNDNPPYALSRRRLVAAAAAGLGLSGLGLGARGAPVRTATSAPSRVIIDTDPGVDDAFALLLAMRSPELRIEAITAVAGNVPLELTLPNALRMVEIASRTDIPVAAGARAPLMRRLVTAAYAHGENGLGGAVFAEPKTAPVAEPAADLIQRLVRQYPGEITLITIGPQTNIATALNADPAARAPGALRSS
jgi:inosine-uridine nucleoside N-ribohydrolase